MLCIFEGRRQANDGLYSEFAALPINHLTLNFIFLFFIFYVYLFPQLLGFLVSLMFVYYAFAIVGMEMFAGRVYPGCCGDYYTGNITENPSSVLVAAACRPLLSSAILMSSCVSFHLFIFSYLPPPPRLWCCRYFLNNFDNIFYSYVTLFELMVVNNWFVIMDAYAVVTSEWSRM
jgi:hypothetical protein